MVSRATKHVFSTYLRKLPLLDVPVCVAHLLNCLVGYKFNSSPTPPLLDDEFSVPPTAKWTKLDVVDMRRQITNEVFKRYRYTLADEWWNEYRCVVLLREVCLKLGFQLKAREYHFEKPKMVINGNGNGKHKKTNGVNGYKSEDLTFYPEDILNVVPIVKDAPLRVYLSNTH
jgi:protein TIF31